MKYTSLIKENNLHDRYIAVDEKSEDRYASATLVYVGIHNLDGSFELQYQDSVLLMNLKWDGCCDIWYLGQDEEVAQHYCGFEMLKQYTKAIEELYNLLKSRIKEWDGD
jgi:hypothetical protein